MANLEHLAILRQGAEAWKKWREDIESRPMIVPAERVKAIWRGDSLRGSLRFDLAGADLRGFDLTGYNLAYVDFVGADFRDARLRNVAMKNSDLSEADLREVILASRRSVEHGL